MTKTEICNRALAVLGHDRTIEDFDGKDDDGEFVDKSTEAERCRQFFGSALDDVLTAHDWDFAAVETPIYLDVADESGWARLRQPDDCIRIVRVTDSHGHSVRIRRTRDFVFVKNGQEGNAWLRYTSSDVDVDNFPPKVREALIYQLAAFICGPMYGSDNKTEGYTNLARIKISDAVTAETDETASPGEWENPFIASRR